MLYLLLITSEFLCSNPSDAANLTNQNKDTPILADSVSNDNQTTQNKEIEERDQKDSQIIQALSNIAFNTTDVSQKENSQNQVAIKIVEESKGSFDEKALHQVISNEMMKLIAVRKNEEMNEKICTLVGIVNRNGNRYSITYNERGMKIRHVLSNKIITDCFIDNFSYTQDGIDIRFIAEYVSVSEYLPKIFDRQYYYLETKYKEMNNEVHKLAMHKSEIPVPSKITYETTAPKMVPTHENFAEYFKQFISLIADIESNQKEGVSVYAEINYNVDCEEIQNITQHKDDQVHITCDCNANVQLDNGNVMIHAPFNIIHPLHLDLCENDLLMKKKLLQTYIPTQIQKKCVFEDEIVFLKISGAHTQMGILTTRINESNIFKKSHGLRHFTQGGNFDSSNVFENSYIGPNVEIGRHCWVTTSYVFSGSKIGNNVVIGPNVIIGQNVIINDGVVLKDYVIVQDGVFIGQNTVIRNNVYISERAIIKRDVKMRYGIFIGKEAIICDGSELNECVFVGENSYIKEGCKIFKDIEIGHEAIIEERSHLENDVIVNGVCHQEKILQDGKNFKL